MGGDLTYSGEHTIQYIGNILQNLHLKPKYLY